MFKKKINIWIPIALVVVLLTATVSILYGEGYLNLGALGIKVKRVAQTACKEGAEKEDKYCVYTLEPIQYFVMKNSGNYEIYGDTITKIIDENSINPGDGKTISATSYSLKKTTPFSSLDLAFRMKEKDGTQIPCLVLDGQTAENVRGARFVEVEMPKLVKIRLNSFYIP
jgi:hypothetical protein